MLIAVTTYEKEQEIKQIMETLPVFFKNIIDLYIKERGKKEANVDIKEVEITLKLGEIDEYILAVAVSYGNYFRCGVSKKYSSKDILESLLVIPSKTA